MTPRSGHLEALRLWLLHKIPAGVLWQPAEWALAMLCAFSGALTLTGLRTTASVAELLPRVVYYSWGAFLILGAAAMAIGLASVRRVGGNYVVTKVPAYRLGLRLLGMVWAVYVICVLAVTGLGGVQASVAPVVISALCGVRLLTLGEGRHQ